jgi:DNA primase
MTTETIEKIYQYRNLDGSLCFEVVRYQPKNFRQRRPDGHGGYIWNLQGCDTVLYRLPEITDAIKRGEPVFIVEGEKDADNAVSKLGLQATTSAMGANKWCDAYSYSLRYATAFICPDSDAAGMKHAYAVADSLWEYCELVKIVRLRFPADAVKKKDLTDFIEQGGTADQIKALCDEAEIYLPFSEWCYYYDKFRAAKTSELYEALEMIRELNQPKFYQVVGLLHQEFKRRKEALEYIPPKKGGVSLAYS